MGGTLKSTAQIQNYLLPYDPQAMIIMGPRALGMGLTTDVFNFLFIGNFQMRLQNAGI